ncbi:MAG TPA: tetratricopeptide repeat protein [Gammaproteobacteria bacterium]|nr:tetratricopeptide repeat protein [Gammaproteobacteria bacterium]
MRVLLLLSIAMLLLSCAGLSTKQSSTMYTGLGDMYAQGNRFAEAENYYNKAHVLEPDKADVMFKLAEAQTQQGKFNQAMATYNQILNKHPQNHIVRYRLARVHMSTGELSNALSQYRLLLKNNKKDFQALNGLGVLLDNLSQFSLAKICYQQGLKYAPRNYALLNNLGVSYALSGNLVQAEQFLDKASVLSSNARLKANKTLIMDYYEKFKDSLIRQRALKQSLLIKNIYGSPGLLQQATHLAKLDCNNNRSP